MPSPKSKRSGSKTVLRVGPAIPLALALLHSAVVPSGGTGGTTPSEPSLTEVTPVACGDSIEDYTACHSEYPTGCSASGKYDAYLNLFKNQTQWTDSQPQKWLTRLSDAVQLEHSIPAGLAKGNHADYVDQLRTLGEGSIHGVVGYLYSVKAEGKESSNCQLDPGTDNENVDFHIFIGFDPDVAARIRDKTTTAADKAEMNPKSMIVEMTPHYRANFHPEWNLDAVKGVIGQQVRVTGQLMVDNEHYVKSQDCGVKGSTSLCWRATVWELHPVTQFEVCDTGSCTASSAGWTPIGGGASSGVASKASPPKTRSRTK
jgi:hypothetical protein